MKVRAPGQCFALLGLALLSGVSAVVSATAAEPNLILNLKKGYAHVIWVVADGVATQEIALALAEGPVKAKFPDTPRCKIDAIRISEGKGSSGFETLARFELEWVTGGKAQVTKQEGSAPGLALDSEDVLMTAKADYTHILWDAFPYETLFPEKDRAAGLEKVARDLILGPGKKKFPQQNHFKVQVVEFKDRDNYGAPRWDTVKMLAKYEGFIGSDGTLNLNSGTH